MSDVEEIISEIEKLNEKQKTEIFDFLRKSNHIHQIEIAWNAPAEIILDAIWSAGELNKRAVRGMLAEAVFKLVVLPKYSSYIDNTPLGDLSFDFLLRHDELDIKIQTKNQRRKSGTPMVKQIKDLGEYYVVETQKTRGGKDELGDPTRPYRFGEFDILAVCLFSSTGNWEDFIFTVSNWLEPDKTHGGRFIDKMQIFPTIIPEDSKSAWTIDLGECIQWLKNGHPQGIKSTNPRSWGSTLF